MTSLAFDGGTVLIEGWEGLLEQDFGYISGDGGSVFIEGWGG